MSNNSFFPDGGMQKAVPAQLEQAAADNHTQLFFLNARAEGGKSLGWGELVCAHSGEHKTAMIAFPRLRNDESGELLDDMMDSFRKFPPANAGCWSLVPTQPANLGVQLLARGFQPGWQPCWMGLDLSTIKTGYDFPPGLRIKADNITSTESARDLPYNGDNGAVSVALLKQFPERARRFLAILDGEVVGHSVVFFSDGPYGAAGLYNVGVVPHARHKGIGKAVVIAACLYAMELGYRYVVLNGTGRRMYEQVGFKWISYGMTWWLQSKQYITNPPSPLQVLLVEAVGTGHIEELDRLSKDVTVEMLNAATTNGMTLMQLATHLHQPAAASWLTDHGANYSVLDAWDIGWREKAEALLSTNPAEVNRLYDYNKITLLHIAAERNDIALARLALSAKPDLDIKDNIYHSNALGWAEHMQRTGIVELIKGSNTR